MKKLPEFLGRVARDMPGKGATNFVLIDYTPEVPRLPCYTVNRGNTDTHHFNGNLRDMHDQRTYEHYAWVELDALIAACQGPKKELIYVAHPVSGAPMDNVFRTVQWIEWFTKNDPTRIYVAPWMGEVLAFPGKSGETRHRAWDEALNDDEQVIEHFDGIILVGGRVSDGMRREMNAASRLNKSVTDMSQYALPENLPEGFFLDPAY